jgi:hypothetical protein
LVKEIGTIRAIRSHPTVSAPCNRIWQETNKMILSITLAEIWHEKIPFLYIHELILWENTKYGMRKYLSYIFLYWSYEYISGNQQNDIINHAYIFMSWSCERIPNMVSENTFPIYSCAGRMRKYISYIYPRAGRHLEDVDVSFFSMSISRPAKTKPGCNFVFKSTWFPLPKNPSCSGAC